MSYLENQFLSQSFKLATVGIVQEDFRTRRFLVVNASFCEIVGYSETELLRLTVDDIKHPDDHELDRELYINLVHGETNSYQSEKRYLRKDGSTVCVLANYNIIRNAQGQPLHTFAIIQDITAWKQLEAKQQQTQIALQQSEENLHLALDLNYIGYWDWNIKTGLLSWNDYNYRLLGYEPGEVRDLQRNKIPVIQLE